MLRLERLARDDGATEQTVGVTDAEGWPPELADLKLRLVATSGNALPAEHPGSKWPKTTLAALKENRRLLPEQLDTLLSICEECSRYVRIDDCHVLVNALSVVLYKCRCLSDILSHNPIPLRSSASRSVSEEANAIPGSAPPAPPLAPDARLSSGSRSSLASQLSHPRTSSSISKVEADGGVDTPIARCVARFRALTDNVNMGVDESEPSDAERAYVRSVMAEAKDPNYWYLVSQDGRRINHYTETAPGGTIAHFLISEHTRSAATLIDAIRLFELRVHKELPDMYSFLPPDSLHVTLRTLT